MKKSYLVALCILVWCGSPVAAQRLFLGVSGGGFDVTASSILGGGIRRGCTTGWVSAGIMVSPRLDLITGIGYCGYFYNEYEGSQPDRTQRLKYLELPLVARFSLKRIPMLRHRGDPAPEMRGDRFGVPLVRFYLEGGIMAGLLLNASRYGASNEEEFYAFNIKPMVGLGILGGGGHRINLAAGLRFYSSLRNEYRKTRSAYQGPETFSLFAVIVHAGIQVRLSR